MDNLGVAGKWLFIAGLVIAAATGLGVSDQAGVGQYVPMALAILGVIVGLLNVGKGESRTFLLSAIALMMTATALSAIPAIGGSISAIMSNISAFIAPAALVVAIKSLFDTARD